MSTAPRRIEEYIPTAEDTKADDPKFVGHLLRMPLTKGGTALIDPDEVVSISPHRMDENVTVIRQKDDKYTYFIDRPFDVVEKWISQALEE